LTGWPAAILKVLFLTLLVGGIALVLTSAPSFDKPETTTTVRVVKGPGAHRQIRESRTGLTSGAAGAPSQKFHQRSVRSKEERPDGGLARQKTTLETQPRSFLESAVGDIGLYALQIAVVFLGAFVAAAIAYRVIVGDFGFSLGALDLNTNAAVVAARINSTRYDGELTKGLEEVGARMKVVEESLEKVAPDSADLPSDLGSIHIEIPDFDRHRDRESNSLALFQARLGLPGQDPNFFKDVIGGPPEVTVEEGGDEPGIENDGGVTADDPPDAHA